MSISVETLALAKKNTKQAVEEAVTSVYRYRGSVETFEDLPTSGQKVGDVYNVEKEAGRNYAWDGSDWDALGIAENLGDIEFEGEGTVIEEVEKDGNSWYLTSSSSEWYGEIKFTKSIPLIKENLTSIEITFDNIDITNPYIVVLVGNDLDNLSTATYIGHLNNQYYNIQNNKITMDLTTFVEVALNQRKYLYLSISAGDHSIGFSNPIIKFNNKYRDIITKTINQNFDDSDTVDKKVQVAKEAAQAANNQANAAYSRASSAYDRASSAWNAANTAYNQANTAYNQANSASSSANTAYSKALSAYNVANVVANTANNAYNAANIANNSLNDLGNVEFTGEGGIQWIEHDLGTFNINSNTTKGILTYPEGTVKEIQLDFGNNNNIHSHYRNKLSIEVQAYKGASETDAQFAYGLTLTRDSVNQTYFNVPIKVYDENYPYSAFGLSTSDQGSYRVDNVFTTSLSNLKLRYRTEDTHLKTINNNYYDKDATNSLTNDTLNAAKAYTDSKFDISLKKEVVQSLPAEGEEDILYLVPKADAETEDIYDEYIWTNNAWEKIGSTATDLSGYYTSNETDVLLNAKQDNINVSGHLSMNGSNIKNTATKIYKAVYDNNGEISKVLSFYPGISVGDYICDAKLVTNDNSLWEVVKITSGTVISINQIVKNIDIIENTPMSTSNNFPYYRVGAVVLSKNGSLYECTNITQTGSGPYTYNYTWQKKGIDLSNYYTSNQVDNIASNLSNDMSNVSNAASNAQNSADQALSAAANAQNDATNALSDSSNAINLAQAAYDAANSLAPAAWQVVSTVTTNEETNSVNLPIAKNYNEYLLTFNKPIKMSGEIPADSVTSNNGGLILSIGGETIIGSKSELYSKMDGVYTIEKIVNNLYHGTAYHNNLQGVNKSYSENVVDISNAANGEVTLSMVEGSTANIASNVVITLYGKGEQELDVSLVNSNNNNE